MEATRSNISIIKSRVVVDDLLDDPGFYETKVRKDSERLFAGSEGQTWTAIKWRLSGSEQRKYCQQMTTIEELETFWGLHNKNDTAMDADEFIIFRQTHTYGRFRSGADVLQRVVRHFVGSPMLLDYVRNFGYKIDDCRESFMGPCYKPARNCDDAKSFEFVYNIRYLEEHNRSLENPWSIRHMAIYQKYDYSRKRSSWVLLQPSSKIEGHLVEDRTSGLGEFIGSHPMSFHLLVFLYAERNWKDYVDYLELQLKQMDERALFSSIDNTEVYDYYVKFHDVQCLERLRHKLLRALNILEGTKAAVSCCKAKWPQFSEANCGNEKTLERLRCVASLIKSHIRSVGLMLERVSGIQTLFARILSHRNDKVQIESNEAIHNNGTVMKEIAAASKLENEAMTILAAKSQRDSRSVKILTYAAMLYLPMTLVAVSSLPHLSNSAVCPLILKPLPICGTNATCGRDEKSIFNSNLIQTVTDASTQGSQTHFAVSHQFWLFPVLSLCLTIATVTPLLALNRRKCSLLSSGFQV